MLTRLEQRALQQLPDEAVRWTISLTETMQETGNPRGLIWDRCEPLPDLCFCRNKQTGELLALAAINIYYRAVPGSDMEDWPAVADVRTGTAVLQWIAAEPRGWIDWISRRPAREGRWQATGRVFLNLLPAAVRELMATQLEAVDSDRPADARQHK